MTTQSVYIGHRSAMKGPWHYCARCGTKVHISEMIWQYGLLVCTTTTDCADHGNKGVPLIGQREAGITHAMENFSEERELMPDPKLSDPDQSGGSADLDLIY